MRFNLLRYYSIASAVAVVAVTAILVIFYGRYATDSLVASIEKQNVILASFVANDLTSHTKRQEAFCQRGQCPWQDDYALWHG